MDVASWKFSRIESKKQRYLWSIVNYSNYHEDEGPLISPNYPFPHDDKLSFHLELFPDCDDFSLHIQKTELASTNIKGKVRFSVLNANKEDGQVGSEITLHDEDGKSNMGGYDCMLENGTLEEHGLLPHDTLTIACDLQILFSVVKYENDNEKIKVPPCGISQDFEKLFLNAKFSDIVLKAEEIEIPAHKAILSARSPVFRAMLEHDTIELKSNRIEIKDLKANILREMLKFMYTGEVSDLKAIASDLLAAADRYGLERLKSMCERAMYASLNIENAVELLTRADLHSALALKAQIITFINGHAALVKQSEGWNNITGPLVVDLYTADK